VSRIESICLLGFGEVGQILADDLVPYALSAWDLKFADPDSGPSLAARRHKLRPARDAAEAARSADLVISAVTAAQDAEAAEAALPGLEKGAFFLDLNSAAPESKKATARMVEAAGAHYVEAAVMSPFAPKRIASPILLGGPHAQDFLAETGELGMIGARFFSAELGRASAAKMCRSVMVKGVEALLTESLVSARHYGVEDAVLQSLTDLFPIGDWRALAAYMIGRSLEHGARRAEEMREAARTVTDAGLTAWMSAATAERQDWAAGRRDALETEGLNAMLDGILGLRVVGGEGAAC
jgi:3-hydroxyisobutyrate dehydrogenase-like beta-hydroxyacid dehydrogenase